MNNPDTCKVSLCLSSKELSAQEITSNLRIQPTESHEIGELLNRRHSRNKLREISSWILDSSQAEEDPLEEHLMSLISVIESRASEFAKLVLHCKLEIYCSLFMGGLNNSSSFILSPNIVERLACIPMEISVVIYPPEESR